MIFLNIINPTENYCKDRTETIEGHRRRPALSVDLLLASDIERQLDMTIYDKHD